MYTFSGGRQQAVGKTERSNMNAIYSTAALELLCLTGTGWGLGREKWK